MFVRGFQETARIILQRGFQVVTQLLMIFLAVMFQAAPKMIYATGHLLEGVVISRASRLVIRIQAGCVAITGVSITEILS
jgi:hypothetical protein